MRAKVRMPTDEEEAAIQRGIAADPDNPELTDAQMAEMRPAAEVMPGTALRRTDQTPRASAGR